MIIAAIVYSHFGNSLVYIRCATSILWGWHHLEEERRRYLYCWI